MKTKPFILPMILVILAIIWFKFVGFNYVKNYCQEYNNPKRYDSIIEKYSKKYNVEKSLVYSVIKNESKFYPFAKSRNASKGLMQISDITYEYAKNFLKVDVDDIYNKETNIQVGVWYLSYLFDIFQDERYVILAYNAGPENIKKWIGRDFLDSNTSYENWNIPFIETQFYINNVLKYKSNYNSVVSN